MTDQDFNVRLKQVIFILLLTALAYTLISELSEYLPGLLGAVALYILSRENYFQLIYRKKWKKGAAAWMFIFYYLMILGLPIYLAATLISPKISSLLNNPAAIVDTVKHVIEVVQQKTGFQIASGNAVDNALNKASAMLPKLFNSTATLLANLAIMLFLLYYMLCSGSDMEKLLFRIIPLKDENTKLLASETKMIIKSNAIGIPLISIIQGATAAVGYMIFGVKDVALWGFLTGLFSFFPVVGTMVIWVPLCIYMFASGDVNMGIGLTLYSIIVTGNIDYFARITIMKKLGDAHPVITMLGIIVGLNLFGFIGLIFGPLLISYIVVLFRIYMNEFVENDNVLEEVNKAASDTTGTNN